jgi:hypothetical protein
LNNAPSLFANSLDDRLRARYFYALLKGRLARFTSMSTMFKTTDAAFLAMLQGESSRGRASELDVARYDKLVKSAKLLRVLAGAAGGAAHAERPLGWHGRMSRLGGVVSVFHAPALP